MQSIEAMTEQILYWLSLDMQVRALAERLLERFAVTVGDLPASAAHHHAEPGGLYRHSLEVALKALEEFEGNMKMEQRPDGSVDSFRSSRNRSRWQFATFIAALCHDLGKLFELDVRGKGETWCPLDEPYAQFGRRTKTPVANWRPEREHGAHAKLSSFLMHHILSRADITYLGLPRFVHLATCLSDGHSGDLASTLAQTVSRADQASVEQARERLMARQIKLPPNTNLYNMLRSARLVEADQTGRSVRKIALQGSKGPISLSALILPTEKVVPKQILSTLPPTHFEIDTEPAAEATTVGES